MNQLLTDYADALSKHRIRYIPSCLVVELLTNLFQRFASVVLPQNANAAAPDLLEIIHTMRTNLSLTAESYAQAHTRFFSGDWSEDKPRARNLISNILDFLESVSRLLDPAWRDTLLEEIGGLRKDWDLLDCIMDEKAKLQDARPQGIGRYFHNGNAGVWRRAMANILLELDGETDYGEVDCLILLCSPKVKQHLLSAIGDIEFRGGLGRRFNPERIRVVSEENAQMTCPECTESARSGGLPAALHGATCRLRQKRPERHAISLKRVSEATAEGSAFRRRLRPRAVGRKNP